MWKLVISISILILIIGCSDPVDINAPGSEPSELNNPYTSAPNFIIVPDTFEFGYAHPGKSYRMNFLYLNQSSKVISFERFTAQYQPEAFEFFPVNVSLAKAPQPGSELEAHFDYSPSKPGYYLDSVKFGNYIRPQVIVKSIVPTLFASDINFGEVALNEFSVQNLTIHNVDEVPVEIHTIIIEDESGDFQIGEPFDFPHTIEANDSLKIKYFFNPTKNQNYSAFLKIRSNGAIPDSIVVLDGSVAN
jgi:hypothetical protein